jgi:hypothetical protein
MAVAQAMNYRLGFAVWPMGEDRVWIDILQKHSALGAAKAFWQINDRNALAPWWYIGLRPIILRYDVGLFLIREIVGLLLAVSAYIFLFAMTQARTFALGIGCVIAVFLANGYLDQIYWTMQVALIFSLCSLTLYKLFLDNRSRDYRLYTGAIVAWFIAMGTYSIQTGAILAIAVMGLVAPATTLFARLRRASTDALPFVLIFIVFLLEWQTTARDGYTERPHLLAAILSVKEAFWHFDYLPFFNGVVYAELSYRLIFIASALLVGAFVFYATACPAQQSAPLCSPWRLLEASIAAGCLVLPVIAVEATGYGIIGEAWRKVYQFTIPFLYLSAAAALFAFLPTKVGRMAWRVTAALLAALATAVTLGINHVQVEVTHNEKLLRAELNHLAQENLAAGYAPPYHFLVRRDPNFIWYSSDFLSAVYGRTWGLPLGTFFRFLPGGFTSDPRQSLRYTDGGVENAALDGTMIGNDHVFVLSAAKSGVARLCRIGAADVSSDLVQWQRSQDLVWTIGSCARSPG